MTRSRGVQEEQGAKRAYIAVSKGDFVRRVEKETKTSVSRELGEKSPNAGDIIHEERFKKFIGELKDIKIDDNNKYGKAWEFIIDVTPGPELPEEMFILKLDFNSGYAADILKRLKNLDLNEDVIFGSYIFTPEGEAKEKMGLTLMQFDANDKPVKIFPYYTKDNPNGLPKWQQVKDPKTGKLVWTSLECFEFLEDMALNEIAPQLSGHSLKAPKISNDMPVGQDFAKDMNSGAEEGGDLPF